MTAATTYGIALLPQHAAMLAASGITPEHARARGYQSVDTKQRVRNLNITDSGCGVPGLLIPERRIDGSVWGYQYRPDRPRMRAGKPVKYETPRGQKNRIDVPPGAGMYLTDPSRDLWITEGCRKADAAYLAGLICIALNGVSGWRGTNPQGGKTALPDWNDIALNGRRVVIAFDSDATRKPEVQAQLQQLGNYLTSKGADVAYCWLPADGSDKVGLDDYLAAGHDKDDLLKLVHPDPPPLAYPTLVAAEPATQTTNGVSVIGVVTDRLTDDGNANSLVTRFADRIRYCTEPGRWYIWDGTRWVQQGARPLGGGVREMAKADARAIAGSDAADKWRGKSLSAIGTSNTITQASTDPRVVVSIHDLDANPWVLNTPTGVVDLRTGDLSAAKAADLHTRVTAVGYDRHAHSDVWDNFLNVTFGGDKDLIGYLQRLIGYSATGQVGPHVLPFAYGGGGNGKGVFLESISKVLGNYATTSPNGFLMARTYSAHETEIARLAGARMVLCSEVNEDDRFDEAKVKQLTGGDTLTARFMRQDHVTFTPTHHLWLVGNHKPAVRSGGRAFWRRCRLIAFQHTVERADEVEDLQGILAHDHGQPVLAWIVQGAIDYCETGLSEPTSVVEATAAYAREQDSVGGFVADRCHLAPGSSMVKVKVSVLRTAYDQWCIDNGDDPVTAKRFTQDLVDRFGVNADVRTKAARFYAGIALESDATESTRDG